MSRTPNTVTNAAAQAINRIVVVFTVESQPSHQASGIPNVAMSVYSPILRFFGSEVTGASSTRRRAPLYIDGSYVPGRS